ncbi:MAG: hypothetical protein M3540_10235 [Actinomycetota bacterium]|nr:hypothetical protein [Actinomycetota bacterium]
MHERFVAAATEAAQAYYDQTPATAVREHPDAAKRGGAEGLRAVKR